MYKPNISYKCIKNLEYFNIGTSKHATLDKIMKIVYVLCFMTYENNKMTTEGVCMRIKEVEKRTMIKYGQWDARGRVFNSNNLLWDVHVNLIVIFLNEYNE